MPELRERSHIFNEVRQVLDDGRPGPVGWQIACLGHTDFYEAARCFELASKTFSGEHRDAMMDAIRSACPGVRFEMRMVRVTTRTETEVIEAPVLCTAGAPKPKPDDNT